MNRNQMQTWDELGDNYPEIAEALMSYLGVAEYAVTADLSSEDRFLLSFLTEDFDEGSGDDLFDEIQRTRGTELAEESPLRDRAFVDERLDYLAANGLVGRIPLAEGGYHYGSLRMCLYYLMEQGDSDAIVVDDLYWFEEKTAIPVQKLVLTSLAMEQASITMTES